jgi:hydroxypyruvate isomerase
LVRFCANVSMLYVEEPFPDRFERAARSGFDAVEFQFPYEFSAEEVRSRLDAHGLELELFNLPAGDFARGDRGMATDPARTDDFRRSVDLALEYASVLKPRKLNCLSGKNIEGVSGEAQRAQLIANLTYAADLAARAEIKLLIEPLNPYDAPNFFLPSPSAGFSIVEEANHPNLFVQYDIYHAQRTEGNIVTALAEHQDRIGHLQLADAPGRNEPGTGELNWAFIFAEIDRLGFSERIGLEYKPSVANTDDTLTWMKEFSA